MGIKISDLTSATSLTGSEELPIVQSGNTKKATVLQVKSHNYSSVEQVIGTWTDGKPLYECTISTTAPSVTSDGTDVTKSIEINNTIDFAYIFSQIAFSTSQSFPLPYTVVGTPVKRMTCRTDRASATNMTSVTIISNGTGFNGTTVVATVRYTKSTDSATRGNVEQLRSTNNGDLVGLGDRAEVGEIETRTERTEEETRTEPIEENNENQESGEELR